MSLNFIFNLGKINWNIWPSIRSNSALVLITSYHKLQHHLIQISRDAHFFRFYGNDTRGTCEPCDSSCVECSGSAKTDCLGCRDGYFLLNHKGICVHVCPSDYFADTRKKTCQRCHPSCKTCESKCCLIILQPRLDKIEAHLFKKKTLFSLNLMYFLIRILIWWSVLTFNLFCRIRTFILHVLLWWLSKLGGDLLIQLSCWRVWYV